MDPNTATVAITSMALLFGVTPAIIFGFIRSHTRGKQEIRKLELQREIAELELAKGEQRLRLLQAENKSLDDIIQTDR